MIGIYISFFFLFTFLLLCSQFDKGLNLIDYFSFCINVTIVVIIIMMDLDINLLFVLVPVVDLELEFDFILGLGLNDYFFLLDSSLDFGFLLAATSTTALGRRDLVLLAVSLGFALAWSSRCLCCLLGGRLSSRVGVDGVTALEGLELRLECAFQALDHALACDDGSAGGTGCSLTSPVSIAGAGMSEYAPDSRT